MRRAAVPSLLPNGDSMLGFRDQILGIDFDVFCTNCISLQYSVTVPYGSIVYLMMYILDSVPKDDVYIVWLILFLMRCMINIDGLCVKSGMDTFVFMDDKWIQIIGVL